MVGKIPLDILADGFTIQAEARRTEDPKTSVRRILRAARAVLGRRGLSAVYEHGQWWVEHRPSGAQWSVVDAEGGGSVDGFDFEQVTQGDED